MCIIAISPANTPIPSEKTRATMFRRNPDGAGFMFPLNGRVHIEKGFMSFKAMEDRLSELEKTIDFYETPIVFHYRITTHGGTKPGNTHPFPVTSNRHMLKELKTDAVMGCAHNGIISCVKPKKGFSDTQEYIVKRIAHLNKAFIHNKDKLKKIKKETNSKLVFLTGDGEIIKVGEFYDDFDGCWYSNFSYEDWSKYTYSYSYIPMQKNDGGIPDYDPKTYKSTLKTLEDEIVIDGFGDMRDGAEFMIDAYGRIYEILYNGDAVLDPDARVLPSPTSHSSRFIYDDWGYDDWYNEDDWKDCATYFNRKE